MQWHFDRVVCCDESWIEGCSRWSFHHVHLNSKAGPELASFPSVCANETGPEKGSLVLLFVTTTLLLRFLFKSSHLKCADALWSLCFYSPSSRSSGKCLLPSLQQNFGSCLINSLVYSRMRLIAIRTADLEEIEPLCGVEPRKSYFKQENSLSISVIIPMWLTGLCPKSEFPKVIRKD